MEGDWWDRIPAGASSCTTHTARWRSGPGLPDPPACEEIRSGPRTSAKTRSRATAAGLAVPPSVAHVRSICAPAYGSGAELIYRDRFRSNSASSRFRLPGGASSASIRARSPGGIGSSRGRPKRSRIRFTSARASEVMGAGVDPRWMNSHTQASHVNRPPPICTVLRRPWRAQRHSVARFRRLPETREGMRAQYSERGRSCWSWRSIVCMAADAHIPSGMGRTRRTLEEVPRILTRSPDILRKR